MPAARYMHPWERQDHESPEAWAAFCNYREAGAERSQAKTARELGKDPGQVNRWCTRYRWVDRSREWDSHQQRVEQAERDRVRARQAAKWEAAKLEGAQANVDLAATLRDRVRKMLAFPLTSQKTKKVVAGKDGMTLHQTIIIKPYRWGGDTIVKMLDLAARLEKAAIEAALPADGTTAPAGGQLGDTIERMIDQIYSEAPEGGDPAPEGDEGGEG